MKLQTRRRKTSRIRRLRLKLPQKASATTVQPGFFPLVLFL